MKNLLGKLKRRLKALVIDGIIIIIIIIIMKWFIIKYDFKEL
jgi:hypothetical protein